MSPKSTLPTGQKASPEAQLDTLLRDVIAEERQLNDMRYAQLRHSHPEFKRLEQSVADLILKSKPQDLSQFALKDHVHPEHIHPLSVIERGHEIEKLLGADLCPRLHQHPDLDRGISVLQESVESMRADIAALPRHEELSAAVQGLREEIRELREETQKIRRSIPVIKEEDPEVMGARFCIIPHRCNGRMIKSILACDYDGSPVEDVVIRCGNQVVTVGSVCRVGDLLSFPPNCIVLLRFQ